MEDHLLRRFQRAVEPIEPDVDAEVRPIRPEQCPRSWWRWPDPEGLLDSTDDIKIAYEFVSRDLSKPVALDGDQVAEWRWGSAIRPVPIVAAGGHRWWAYRGRLYRSDESTAEDSVVAKLHLGEAAPEDLSWPVDLTTHHLRDVTMDDGYYILLVRPNEDGDAVLAYWELAEFERLLAAAVTEPQHLVANVDENGIETSSAWLYRGLLLLSQPHVSAAFVARWNRLYHEAYQALSQDELDLCPWYEPPVDEPAAALERLLEEGRHTQQSSDDMRRLRADVRQREATAQSPVAPGRARPGIPEGVRHAVWRRDEGRCVDCGSQEKLEFDHIVPLSRGGSDTERNLQLLCEPCNRRKGARI